MNLESYSYCSHHCYCIFCTLGAVQNKWKTQSVW